MTLSQPPCKDCMIRFLRCHTNCLSWKQWKAKDDAKKAEIKAAKDREKAIDDFIFNAPRRITLDACRRANKKARA